LEIPDDITVADTTNDTNGTKTMPPDLPERKSVDYPEASSTQKTAENNQEEGANSSDREGNLAKNQSTKGQEKAGMKNKKKTPKDLGLKWTGQPE
jgi:hypothetical protein